ncbi:LLM class flavin-dependent oxidoreductase [Corynebacterium nasicanis]|uniref:LLM class flavin-dependent oxidoreductase n=1 Tax=Corynebacterium nasicanis TaxID=1448267 RepID=A0ABW1Q841_9CORY
MNPHLTFGLDTFGDVNGVAPDQVLRNVVAEAVEADRVGVDVFGIGEHHRDDYAVSSPDIVLATIAGRTERIHLTTSVIVLSSDDPVRIMERFSTLQALSSGRAEITLGRGSFVESFPLFGYDLADYERLFEEKLELIRVLLDAASSGEPIAWDRGPAHLYPPLAEDLPVWVAVGGSPESVLRAARHRLPLMLAIIGGSARRFRPFVDLYRREIPNGPVGVHSPGLIAPTDTEAQERLFEHWLAAHRRIGAERGWSQPTAEQFMAEVHHGSLYVGSPETVARKIADTVSALELDRFTLKYATGPISHEHNMETIRLYGEEVIPRVRELLG